MGTCDAGTKLVESIEVGSLVEGVSELPVLMSACNSAGVIGETAKAGEAGKLVELITEAGEAGKLIVIMVWLIQG